MVVIDLSCSLRSSFGKVCTSQKDATHNIAMQPESKPKEKASATDKPADPTLTKNAITRPLTNEEKPAKPTERQKKVLKEMGFQ